MRRDVYLVRLTCVALGLLTGYAFLSVHLFKLQIVRHEELLGKARQKYTARRTHRGSRGYIYDVNGNPLVGNLACRDIMAEPRRFDKCYDHILDILSRELGLDRDALHRRLKKAKEPGSRVVEVVVKRQVDMTDSERLKKYHKKKALDGSEYYSPCENKHCFNENCLDQLCGKVNLDKESLEKEKPPSKTDPIPGLRFVESSRRYHLKERLMANLLGFTDSQGAGVVGVEKLLDQSLRPHDGEERFERDPSGNRLHQTQASAARDGDNVYLTLSEPIQQIMEDELAAMVGKHAPSAAYALMTDPRTGAVLGMAQYPSFNPNDRRGISPDQWQNRILLHGFEPGSTMKCVAIAGAMDYNVVDLDTVFDCEDGYWVFCRRGLRDSGHKYGNLAVWEIVQKSSNIGTAKIALEMGQGRLYQTLHRFGFGQPTGLDHLTIGDLVLKPPLEASGIFRPLHKWDGLSISRFPIGQGILVTPLQMVQAYGALANDGVMMQLHTIDRLEVAGTGEVRKVLPQVKGRVLRPGSARQIVKAMKLVTQKEGTAPKAAVEGYEVAGKTGTAQKVVDGQYSSSKYVASFIGFVPADNPSFVLIVVADEPSQNGYYGGTVAAPTFSRIAEKTLRYMQIAPTPVRHRTTSYTERLVNADPGKNVSELP